MPAYVIVEIEVVDEPAYADYRRRAPAVVRQFGGRYLARARRKRSKARPPCVP